MTADVLRSIVLVLLALAAVGVIASTMDPGGDPVETPAVTPEPTEEPPSLGSDGGAIGPGIALPALSCPAALTGPANLGAAAIALLVFGGLLYRVRGSTVVPIAVIGPILVGLGTLCGSAISVQLPEGRLLSTPAIVGALLVAVGGVVAVLYVVTSDDERLESAIDDDAGPDVDLAAVGNAAGAAADRIERQADVTNEVYRAWREMTTHLDVPNPEATTPSEFADAAIAAGMEREDVATLTRLFEEVRYGDRDPDAREERALEALRGIERTYGGEPE